MSTSLEEMLELFVFSHVDTFQVQKFTQYIAKELKGK